MSNFIVTTTINPVTEAINKYDNLKNWKLIVVGDIKTPKNYKLKNGIYLPPKDQIKIDNKLSDLIPWNSIQRRNFGFILAKKYGAKIIASIDDDNIPKKNWGEEILIGKRIKINEFITKQEVFDPLSPTNENRLWHRGFPLQLILKKNQITKKRSYITADVQADFWDGDPDVDAIERFIFKTKSKFKKDCFPFFSKKIAPFNTQNTFISSSVIKNYFMFPYIGRMEDIWAAYYIQSKGYKVIFNKATVIQKRNVHDITDDFSKEIVGYLNNLNLVKSLKKNPENIKNFIPKKSYYAFKQYQKNFL